MQLNLTSHTNHTIFFSKGEYKRFKWEVMMIILWRHSTF